MIINIKPLSVNEAYNGRRTRTKKYNVWLKDIGYLLPKIKPFKGCLRLELVFGVSSKGSDLDNCTKSMQDVLSKRYGFNDNQIYELILRKVIVKKGKEFIDFKITEL